MMTPAQIEIVRSTAPLLKQYGDKIGTVFYGDVMEAAPVMNNVFNRAHQDNGKQAHAIAAILYAYAVHIDDLGVLDPAIEKICHKHASLYIQADLYVVVGNLLMGAISKVLGPPFSGDVKDAWISAYNQLAALFIQIEENHYKVAAEHAWSDWRKLRIARKVPESSEITSFYFEEIDSSRKLPQFLPGQFISVKVSVPRINYLQSRQYSLSAGPNQEYYRISVKKEEGIDESHPGYVSNVLHDDFSVGQEIEVSHPQGEFVLADGETPVCLISAGVGITPLMSMLESIINSQPQRRVSFIHGSRSAQSRPFYQQLLDYEKQHGIRYTSFVSQPSTQSNTDSREHYQSRVNPQKLDPKSDLFIEDSKAVYYMCGPSGFLSDMERGLVEQGVTKDRIYSEIFGPSGKLPDDANIDK